MDRRIFKAVEGAVNKALERNTLSLEDFNKALAMITDGYSLTGLVTEAATSLNFSEPLLRWAYTYLKTVLHTHMVIDVLETFWRSSPTLDDWHNALVNSKVRVCCVGGGPGSDLLAVALFIRKQRLRVAGVQGDILDQWVEWEDIFFSMADRLDPARIILPEKKDVTYKVFHFYQEESWPVESISEADLVTMVKFVSAVSADRDFCERQLSAMLRNMKDGAILFVLTNAGGGYTELTTVAAENAGLLKLNELCHEEVELAEVERNAMNSSGLCRSLIMHPQRTAKFSATLWKKISAHSTCTSLSNGSGDLIQVQPVTGPIQRDLPSNTAEAIANNTCLHRIHTNENAQRSSSIHESKCMLKVRSPDNYNISFSKLNGLSSSVLDGHDVGEDVQCINFEALQLKTSATIDQSSSYF